MNAIDQLAKEMAEIIKETINKKVSAYDTQAEVLRVEDGIAWVHIPGGVDETPVSLTLNANKGDLVQVRVSGGNAWLTGNGSSPPTDDTTANYALNDAQNAIALGSKAMAAADAAEQAAESAWNSASEAEQAATEAKTEAQDAANAAADAETQANLATEYAVDAKEQAQTATDSAATAGAAASVAQAAAEAAAGEIADQKEYFWHDANGAHILGSDSGYRTDVESSGLKIKKTDTEKTVASFGVGEIVIGSETDQIRNVIASTRQSFRTDSGDIAWFGLNEDGIWEMHISTTYAEDMIRFGNYAWIKRANGNMTIKWLGD